MDEPALAAAVDRVIDSHQSAADDVRRGENKAIGFLVGQVMKETAGRADPALARQLITERIGRAGD
jgi:aspartyl-tRNA(Asn)/glutamyl-tRNA(Gln) amidotransferase subunit B